MFPKANSGKFPKQSGKQLLIYSCFFLSIVSNAQIHQTDTVSIFFDFGLFRPNVSGRMQLLTLSRFDLQEKDSIVCLGYTDTKGSIEFNKKLSLQRALAVANCIRPGLEATAIAFPEAIGMGIDSSAEKSAKQKRRVDIIIFHIAGVSAAPYEKKSNTHLDTVLELPNIYFNDDRAVLTGSSRLAMPSVIKNLIRYKKDSMDVIGYCNFLNGTLSENDPLFKLSIERAKVIADLLIDAGFDSTRIRYFGRGNQELEIMKPKSDEEKRKNMRVVIRIFR